MKSIFKNIFNTSRSRHYFIFASGGALVIAVIIIASAVLKSDSPARAESYKQVSGGAAGLLAIINYDCAGSSCGKNTKFNFNVYIFNEDGQQVGVVRPDHEGNVRTALPEGNYIMLIGKRFGGVFPQESIPLKKGQELELKLRYK